MTKSKVKPDQVIFNSIRKPSAPPAKKIGLDKPFEKARPSLRKSKHKKTEEQE